MLQAQFLQKSVTSYHHKQTVKSINKTPFTQKPIIKTNSDLCLHQHELDIQPNFKNKALSERYRPLSHSVNEFSGNEEIFRAKKYSLRCESVGQCQKKILPQNLRIIYYGPIKGSKSEKFSIKGGNSRKLISSTREFKTTSILENMETDDRYYDQSKTITSEEIEDKKMTSTYYPLIQNSIEAVQVEKTQIVNKELILYALVLLTGSILLLKALLH